MHESPQQISSTRTRAQKIRIPLIVITVSVFLAIWTVADEFVSDPWVSSFVVIAIAISAALVIWFSGLLLLADSVSDHVDYLRISRGATIEDVPFVSVSRVTLELVLGLSAVKVHFAVSTPFGSSIAFLPNEILAQGASPTVDLVTTLSGRIGKRS